MFAQPRRIHLWDVDEFLGRRRRGLLANVGLDIGDRSHGGNRAILLRPLRQAASTLLRTQSYLGAQYRRLRAKLGNPKAVKAMAGKLARLIYRGLKYCQVYVDKGSEFYEQKYRQQQIKILSKKATGARSASRRSYVGLAVGFWRARHAILQLMAALPRAD